MNPRLTVQERYALEIELLLEISKILDQSLELRDVVSPVLEVLSSKMHFDHAMITLLNRQTSDIQIEASYGLSQKETKATYKLGEGVTGQVVLSGEPAIIPKTSESPIFLNRTQKQRAGEHSFLCVPIKTENEILGTISADRLYDKQADLSDDLRLLQVVTSLIAQAVKLRRMAEEEKDVLTAENERLRDELKTRFRPSNIIGNSHEMQNVYDQVAQVSKSAATVLIEGETGTGKELVAHAIHYNSDRSEKPFIKAHCAALPENIIESELFGHEKGAFTGATTDRKGRFELAHGGTLFLDEIGEIPVSIQIKLLRVLQEKEFERVGGTKTIKVNVRLIAATNKNLQDMANEGTFREDLFYRLNVFPIAVPPLRKRKSDVGLLADYFLEKYAKENAKEVRRMASAAIDMLYTYHWPGNVRELENAMERSVVVADSDVLHPHHLPPSLQTAEATGGTPTGKLKDMIEAYEKDLIIDALKSTRGNMASAARNLGTTQRIFGYKVHKYDIDPKKHST